MGNEMSEKIPQISPDRNADTAPSRVMSLPVIGEVDGRTRPALLYKTTVAALVADLGGEGFLSHAQLQLVQRAAGLAVLAAQHEARIVAGEKVDTERYIAVVNAVGRNLTRLGLQRRARNVTPPDLHDYINQGVKP